jgi:hypothetical protein
MDFKIYQFKQKRSENEYEYTGNTYKERYKLQSITIRIFFLRNSGLLHLYFFRFRKLHRGSKYLYFFPRPPFTSK